MKLLEPFGIDDTTFHSSNVVETLDQYDPEATYATGDQVRDDTTHHAFESLTDGNTGHALTDIENWLDLGPTNPWAMFDDKVGTVTTNPETIEVHFAVPGRATGIALFGIDAATAQVIVTDAIDGEVFNQTYTLVTQDNVNDFYDYFFAPILRRSNYFIEGLPPYSGAEITVILQSPGGVVKCGNLVAGDVRTLGTTVVGAGFGIIDYSRKEADADFGTVELIERSYRATGSFTEALDPLYSDEVGRVLTTRRALPTVYVGDGDFASLLIYGFARDWTITKDEADDTLEITLEGLT